MANASPYVPATVLSEQLSKAMQSRAVIEQAKVIHGRAPLQCRDGDVPWS